MVRCNTENDFWDKVVKTDSCWLWQGCTDAFGYGFFSWRGVAHRTHRMAWELTNGVIPNGSLVCHHCDHPLCVNPSHLFLGTNSDNQLDKKLKHRSHGGKNYAERNGSVILSKEQVAQIKVALSSGVTQIKLAKQYGVAPITISHINVGDTWRDVGMNTFPCAPVYRGIK